MAAAAGAASSLVPSTSQRRLPFRPTPTRQPLLAATVPKKTLTLSPKPPRLLHPLAASSSSSPPSPPPPEDAEPTDPVKLAFARAAAYKKERANPTPPPPPPPPSPPPPPEPSAKESSGSKEAFERALEYRNGDGGGLDGGSPLLNPSPTFGQSTFTSKDGAFGKVAKKKGGYAYDETDFLGLGFFEKKRYQGPPPGLSQGIDPFSNEDFPEVEIVVGDPSKFGKSRRSTENQPADDSESEETSPSKDGKQNEDSKLEETPLSIVIEPEDDENSESYKPRVTTWGMFPRPQNISKAYGGGRNISLGGETQSAEEKAAKDKRTRELLAAYIGGKNKTLDAKTKAECTKALKEGDELMNAGRLKQALPYYEKVMQAADFKMEARIRKRQYQATTTLRRQQQQDEVVDPAEARRCCRDIREGKRPFREIPEKKYVPPASSSDGLFLGTPPPGLRGVSAGALPWVSVLYLPRVVHLFHMAIAGLGGLPVFLILLSRRQFLRPLSLLVHWLLW